MRTKIVVALLGVVLAAGACTGTGTPPVRLTPSPSASAGPPLLAVLLRSAGTSQAGAVAIVGLDGGVRARATFEPRRPPFVGNAQAVLQSEAQVGRAGVYYVDGRGVVRLLEPSGRTSVVATFAMTPGQHELWYAVSPDGSRLLAGVLTVPSAVSGQPFPEPSGTWKFDLESARAGGPTTVLQHVESAVGPDSRQGTPLQTVFPVGWTGAGPVAMVGAPLATQAAWPGGPLYVIDAAGRPAARIGGGDCTSAHVLPSGIVPCVAGAVPTVTVRDSTGTVLWTPAVDGGDALHLALSPAGDAITDTQRAVTRAGPFNVPPRFSAAGWVDSQTLVGRPYQGAVLGDLSYVTSRDDPAFVHDLGIQGDFAGVLPAPG